MSDDIEDRVKQAQEQNRQDNAPGSENIGLEGDGKSGALSQARDMIAEHNQLAADVNAQMFAQDDAMIDDAIRSGNEGVAGNVLNQPDSSEQIDNQPDPPTHEQQDEAAGGDADGGNTDQTAPEEPQQEQPAPEQPQPEAEQPAPAPAPEQPAPAEPQSEAAAPDNGGATAASYEVPTAQTTPAPDATASAEPSGLAGSSNVPGVSEHPYGPDDVFTNVPNPEGPASGDGPAIAPPSMPDTVPSAPGGDSPSTPDVPGGPQPSQPQPDQPATPEPSVPAPAPQPSTPAPQPEPQPEPQPSSPSAQPEPEPQQPQNVPAQGDNGKAAYLRRQADRIEQRADMADNAANRGDRNMMRQGVLHQMDKRTLVHDTGVAGRLQGGKKSALLSHNAQLAADIRDSARTQSKLTAQYSRVHKDAAVGYRQANKLRKAADQMESKKAQPQQQVEPQSKKEIEPKKDNKQVAPAPKAQSKSLTKVVPKPKAKPAPKPKPKAPAPSAGNQQKIAEVPKQSMPGVGTGPSIGNIGGAGGKPFRTNMASYIEAPKLPNIDPRQIAKAGVQLHDNAEKLRDNIEDGISKVSPMAGFLIKGQRKLGDAVIGMTLGGMLSNAMGDAVRNYANGADDHKTKSTALVEGQSKKSAPKGMKQLAPSKDVPQLSSTPDLPSASANNFTLNDLGKSTLQRVMMTDEAYNGGDKQLQQQAFDDAMKSYGDILKSPSAGEAMFSQESKSEQMKIAQEAFQQAGLGTINKGAAPQLQNQPSSFRTNRRLDALQDRLGDAAAKERSANRDFESQDLKYC